ncbi:MAG TPA: glycosyltransferase [Myxococcales bacterium]|jgi:glycosyltransferase involved in cell wall biosynthesis|nr:glycosyltransferase [Myxococcales bacterium]
MFSSDIPVLHLVNRFWIGGAERQFVERLRRHPKGFRAVVGCLEASGPLLEQVRGLGHEPEVFPLNGSMMKPNTALQIARMAALIRAEGVKVVHATDFNTNLMALGAARLTGAKAIVSRVDLGHLRAGFGRWHRELEKLNARAADLVVANADAVREVCIAEEGVKPENCVVVRNGLDLEHFDRMAAAGLQAPLPVPDGAPFVAVIGNLWPVKGHRTLVEAVARLPEAFHGVHFLCAGEGPEREYLTGRIAQLGLGGRIHLLGHRLDVPAILSRARAGCLCSSAEGLSNALMEAMAARLPIVATRVGGNPELIHDGENGYLVPYGDPAALAEKLAHLLGAVGPAREMGLHGRRRVEAELTMERMADGHGALYRRALGAAPLVHEPALGAA